jgi:PIN domain nuclease of toxin-antitoxin system
MNLLLDTHTFLWFLVDHKNLSPRAKELIEDTDNSRFLSIASIWEIAIKVSLQKLTLHAPFGDLFPRQMIDNDIDILPVSIASTAAVITLPFHHRDPFDRMLIAQAMTEQMPIVSADTALDAYLVNRLW